jgi:hypothetical protein
MEEIKHVIKVMLHAHDRLKKAKAAFISYCNRSFKIDFCYFHDENNRITLKSLSVVSSIACDNVIQAITAVLNAAAIAIQNGVNVDTNTSINALVEIAVVKATFLAELAYEQYDYGFTDYFKPAEEIVTTTKAIVDAIKGIPIMECATQQTVS